MNQQDRNANSAVCGKSSVSSQLWKTAPGYVIAIACLVWIFHDIRIRELTDSMTSINWWWVAAAVFFDTISYVCQGMRWSLLLHPLGRVSTLRGSEAIYAGLFVNEMLPMRLGEVLRIYLISRWIQVRFAAVIPSMLVERFFDAIWLALAFGITMFAVPLPKYMVDAEGVLGFTALGTTVLFIFLVFRKGRGDAERPTGSWSRWGPIRWISSLLDKMAGGIRDIGRSRFFYSSFGISLLLLLGQILSYWLVMLAYGLRLSFWHGAAIFLIVHIGTIIPGAPSNVGTYQFFTVVGLTLFGIDKTLATSFSIVVFFILTIPLWAIGMLVFGRLGLTLKKVQTEIAALAKSGAKAEADEGPLTRKAIP
jgi:glycosyltransferase 2 family protein